MTTPPPGIGGGADSHPGSGTPSKSIAETQRLSTDNSPLIVVSGTFVRIVGGFDQPDVPPRRQSFAWEADAKAYAERLSRERGWPIEAPDGEE